MLFLHKLLPMFVLPLGWVVVFLGLAIWKKKRWPAIAALVVLYLSSIGVVGDGLTRRLESTYPMIPLKEAPKVDAIVVLGGLIGPPVKPGQILNLGEAVERLEAGIQLWQAKKAEWLVFTGGRIPWLEQVETEGASLRRIAIERGVPGDRILVTGEVGNTADEARLVKGLLAEHGFGQILLVTSAWHMPRAARMFVKAGVGFAAFPVDYQLANEEKTTLLDFLPSAGGLRRTETALREWYGIAYYALRGM
jgi:uncharacterized SAM-binding protein YcdF (DUF218 family)